MMDMAGASRPRYTARAERDGRFWFLRVDGRPAIRTQAARLELAEAAVRDLVALWDEVPADSFDVEVVPVLAPELASVVGDAVRNRADAELAEAAASRASRRAVDALAGAGLTVRDIGAVLGISHQRASQLVGNRR